MMKAVLSLLLVATAASADLLASAPDTLRVELSHKAGNGNDLSLQVTLTNTNTEHFYFEDPSESLSNPREDTYRFDSEPVPGAARFNGVVHGTITYAATSSDANGDWDRLRRWKDVALTALRVPANGGVVSFNVTPTDYVEFSAAGTYTMSMGLTLVALSPDKSKILNHRVSTNSVNVTMAAPTSTEHNDKLSRRALDGLTCTNRTALLVDSWVQQALFSVKDAKTEALGGKFYGKYPDDIDFCFGPGLKAKHQQYISESLEKLEQLLDPTGTAKFTALCDNSDTTDNCQPDAPGNVADSWFISDAQKTDVTLCGSFFYAASHCAYQYKSATNRLASLLVRALDISKPVQDTTLMAELLPYFEQEYNPSEVINKKLTADQRVEFYPSWDCFLSRRSKDAIVTKDACNADEQITAGTLSSGLLEEEIFLEVASLDANSKNRRLSIATDPESILGRRELLTATKTVNGNANVVIGAMALRPLAPLIETPWDTAIMDSSLTAYIAQMKREGSRLRFDGSNKKLNALTIGVPDPKCAKIKEELDNLSRGGGLNSIHNVLTTILTEAAGTGVFDLSSANRQINQRGLLITALAGLTERAVKLKVAFGLAVDKGCWWSGLRQAQKVMAALAPAAKVKRAAVKWTQAEPRAMALARATVVVLLGSIFHDYNVDKDLSGDQLMNVVIHRLNDAEDDYQNQVLGVLTRAYDTVLRVASAFTIGTTGQTPEHFNDLGLHKHFTPLAPASGRLLLDELMTNIHTFYANSNAPALSSIDIPATKDEEFDLLTLVKRKKRQEVRELTTAQWTLYKRGIAALHASGVYADLIYTHNRYFPRMQIHGNPRFLPWHRAFLMTFDDKLSEAMGVPIRAPYWDWTCLQPMTNSLMFTDPYFGSFGDSPTSVLETPVKPDVLDFLNPAGEAWVYPGTALEEGVQPGMCIATGHDFSVVANFDRQGSNRCVTRAPAWVIENFIGGAQASPTQKRVDDLLALKHVKNDYIKGFAYNMEGGLHDGIHSIVKGDMSKRGSPADPIFWSHHAMLDNVWAEWQERQGVGNEQDFYDTDLVYGSYGLTGGKSDFLNQGFNNGQAFINGAGIEETDIIKDTPRKFRKEDKMIFLEPKFNPVPGTPATTRWQISDLLSANYMYRTFQFRKVKYAPRAQPDDDGLDMS